MKSIINLISNKLFEFDPIENDDWEILTDQQKAEIYLYNDDVEQVWLDLREKNDLDWDFPRNQDEETQWRYVQKDILQKLQKAGYEAYYDEVEYDLLNCYLNIKHRQNNPLWNMIFKAYKKGAFPCGWKGEYPNGKLIVFHPKYQPNTIQKLHDLVADFFEKLEILVQNPIILDDLCNLFDEKGEIVSDKGEEHIGIEKIKTFFQKIIQENTETKYLWQKQLTNNKNYFAVRTGFVIKTKNGAIKAETKTMAFDIKNGKIYSLEIVK